MTISEKYMQELTETVVRFATPNIVIGKEVLLGFAANRSRIEELNSAFPPATDATLIICGPITGTLSN